MARRALITGAAGFVGRILMTHLSGRGWETIGVSLNGEYGTEACDITDAEAVRETFRRISPVSHVFHLAAISFVPDAMREPNMAFRVNLEGTLNIANAVCTQAPSARLIYVGSADAYGPPSELPIVETQPLRPVNPYGISKAAADQLCEYFMRTHGLDVVRLRPFNHSGPGQEPRFVLPAFAKQIAEIEAGHGEPCVRVGSLDVSRDFLHVADVVRAYELCALHGKSGEAYNVSSGRDYRIGDALETLISLSRVRVRVEVDPERLRPVDIPAFFGSHEKLTRDTGWKPEIAFEQLLGDLLEYWRKAVQESPA